MPKRTGGINGYPPPIERFDQQLIIWAVECGIPVQVLLTKADKLKSGARKAQLLEVRQKATEFGGEVNVDLFSSLSGIGVDILRNKLDQWFAPALITADNESEEHSDSANEAE